MTLTEEHSGFGAFWQKSVVDKVSFKSVKFVSSNPTTGKGNKPGEENDDEGESSGLTQKQRRRAQVRKAQIEHRQRKENYVKHLEQDVINLREAIAQAETESVLFKHENEGIKSVLKDANLIDPSTLNSSPPTQQEQPQLDEFDAFMDFTAYEAGEPGSSNNSSHDMLINTTFDEWIDSTILQISPVNSHSSSSTTGHQIPTSLPGPSNDIYNTTDIYNFPTPFANPINTASSPSQGVNANQIALSKLKLDSNKPLPPVPGQEMGSGSQGRPQKARLDVETIAINFILALEHPCRTHFHPSPPTFIPTSPPSGHTLMASTLIYTTAPSSIYSPVDSTPLESASWTIPSTSPSSIQLSSLYSMSKSLPKQDWEITPVQAWFLLVEQYGVGLLMGDGVLEGLKRGVGRLVNCFEFGAVMDKGRFWEVVEGELGVGRRGEGGGKGKGKGKI